jgi:hypothetical protein
MAEEKKEFKGIPGWAVLIIIGMIVGVILASQPVGPPVPPSATAVVPPPTTPVSQMAQSSSAPPLEVLDNPPVKHARINTRAAVYHVSGDTADASDNRFLDTDAVVTISGTPREYRLPMGSINLVKISSPKSGYISTRVLSVDLYQNPSTAPGSVGEIQYENGLGVVPNSANGAWVQVGAPEQGWIQTN